MLLADVTGRWSSSDAGTDEKSTNKMPIGIVDDGGYRLSTLPEALFSDWFGPVIRHRATIQTHHLMRDVWPAEIRD